jgi:hypothetical protein
MFVLLRIRRQNLVEINRWLVRKIRPVQGAVFDEDIRKLSAKETENAG